jgi:hypothetical protein
VHVFKLAPGIVTYLGTRYLTLTNDGKKREMYWFSW